MKTLLLALILFAQRPASLGLQAGTVTGRLLNSDGSPAARTRVSATPIPDSPGVAADRQTLMTLTETDDSGNYRLANVPVGRYYIVAGFVDSPTYYPRGKDSSAATPVNVTANATTSNIDFRIEKSSSGLTISGKVTAESAKLLANVQVSLAGGANGSIRTPVLPSNPTAPLNSHESRRARIRFRRLPRRSCSSGGIVVAEKDITGLELQIPWTTVVGGQITVESDALLPVPAFNILFTGGNTKQITPPLRTHIPGDSDGRILRTDDDRSSVRLLSEIHNIRFDKPYEGTVAYRQDGSAIRHRLDAGRIDATSVGEAERSRYRCAAESRERRFHQRIQRSSGDADCSRWVFRIHQTTSWKLFGFYSPNARGPNIFDCSPEPGPGRRRAFLSRHKRDLGTTLRLKTAYLFHVLR